MIINVKESHKDILEVDIRELYDCITRRVEAYLNDRFHDHYENYLYDQFEKFMRGKMQVILDKAYAEAIERKIELLFAHIKAQEKVALEIVENQVADMQQRMDALYYMMYDLQNSIND